MIEREQCSYLICDECPEDDPESSDYGESEAAAIALAKGEGWRVDGDHHICWRCIEGQRHAECAADGGHVPQSRGLTPDGAQVWECRDCGYMRVDEQPALVTPTGDPT